MNNYSLEETKEKRKNSFITFVVSEKRYGININCVNEIINMPEIEIPPSAPEGIIGVFNYGGSMIKITDIGVFSNRPREKFSINDKLIIIMNEGGFFAIHADEIENIVNVSDEEITAVPFEYSRSVTSEIYKDDSGIVNILDIKLLEEGLKSFADKKGSIDYAALIPNDDKSRNIFKLRALQNKKNDEVFSFNFNINEQNQYILFTLSGQNYYMDLKYVKEFVSRKNVKITTIPYTEPYVKGLVNIKGGFYVVIDLNCFINGQVSNDTGCDKIIVAEGKNFNIAFAVDEVKCMENLSPAKVKSSDFELSKYICSEFEEDGVLYNILNFERIIDDERMYINVI